jgi:hypothetical protein
MSSSKISVALEKRSDMKGGMESIIDSVGALIIEGVTEPRQINAVIAIHDHYWSPNNRDMARSLIDTIKVNHCATINAHAEIIQSKLEKVFIISILLFI